VVSIGGGANLAQQCLRAGLVDEIQIHLAPLLLGQGIRLFDDADHEPVELEQTRVIDAPGITHVMYRVVKPSASG
jgi:dihydrofolate reductase